MSRRRERVGSYALSKFTRGVSVKISTDEKLYATVWRNLKGRIVSVRGEGVDETKSLGPPV